MFVSVYCRKIRPLQQVRGAGEEDIEVNPNPVPFQPQNFMSSTVMKKVPIPKRHLDTFGTSDLNFASKRGVVLHTDRYQLDAKTLEGLNQRDRLLAELDYVEKLRTIKRRREVLPHRAELDLMMGGRKIEMEERFDIQREIQKLKSLVLPQNAKDLYHGRGFLLPSDHSSMRPRHPAMPDDFDSDEEFSTSAPASIARLPKPSQVPSLSALPPRNSSAGAGEAAGGSKSRRRGKLPSIPKKHGAPGMQVLRSQSHVLPKVGQPQPQRQPGSWVEEQNSITSSTEREKEDARTWRMAESRRLLREKTDPSLNPVTGKDVKEMMEISPLRKPDGTTASKTALPHYASGKQQQQQGAGKEDERHTEAESDMDMDLPEGEEPGEEEAPSRLPPIPATPGAPPPTAGEGSAVQRAYGTYPGVRRDSQRTMSVPQTPNPNPLKTTELGVEGIPEDERNQLRQTFERLDTDKDGHLHFNQVRKGLPEDFTQPQERFVKQVYDITSKQTFFGADEFLTMTQLSKTVLELKGDLQRAYQNLNFDTLEGSINKYMKLFQAVDRVGKGKVTIESLRGILGSALGREIREDSSEWSHILSCLAVDMPGLVTRVEFLAHIPYFITMEDK